MNIKTKLIAASALIAASFAAIPSANAGGLTVEFGFGNGHGYHGLYEDAHFRRFVPEYRIRHILRNNGFHHADVWREGRFYFARARKHGHFYRVRLSAFNGHIISVHRAGGGWGGWNGPVYY